MRILLLCLVILACSAPNIARACDTPSEATAESTCVVLKRDEIPGVWFNLATADDLRKLKLEMPELRLQVTGLEAKIITRDSQLTDYREVVRLKDVSLATSDKNMKAFSRRARKAEAALDAWYRSPYLWAGIGAVTTVGLWAMVETEDLFPGVVLAGAGAGTGMILFFFI